MQWLCFLLLLGVAHCDLVWVTQAASTTDDNVRNNIASYFAAQSGWTVPFSHRTIQSGGAAFTALTSSPTTSLVVIGTDVSISNPQRTFVAAAPSNIIVMNMESARDALLGWHPAQSTSTPILNTLQTLTKAQAAAYYTSGLFTGVDLSQSFYASDAVQSAKTVTKDSSGYLHYQQELVLSGSSNNQVLLLRFNDTTRNYCEVAASRDCLSRRPNTARLVFAAITSGVATPWTSHYTQQGRNMILNMIEYMYRGVLACAGTTVQEANYGPVVMSVTLDRNIMVGDGTYAVTVFALPAVDGKYTISPDSVVIPEGSRTAQFTVTGLVAGSSTVGFRTVSQQPAFNNINITLVPITVTKRLLTLNLTVSTWDKELDAITGVYCRDGQPFTFKVRNLINGDTAVLRNGITATDPISHTGSYSMSQQIFEGDTYDIVVTNQRMCGSEQMINCSAVSGRAAISFTSRNVQIYCNTTRTSLQLNVLHAPNSLRYILNFIGYNGQPVTSNQPNSFPTGAVGLHTGEPNIGEWVPDFGGAGDYPGIPIGSPYNLTFQTCASGPGPFCNRGYDCGSFAGVANLNPPIPITVDCKHIIAGHIFGCPNCDNALVLRNTINGETISVKDGPFVFPTPIAYGGSYTIVIAKQFVEDGTIVCEFFDGVTSSLNMITPVMNLNISCGFQLNVSVSGLGDMASMNFYVNGSMHAVVVNSNGATPLAYVRRPGFTVTKTGPMSGGVCTDPIPNAGFIPGLLKGGVVVSSTCGYQLNGTHTGLPASASVPLQISTMAGLFDTVMLTGSSQGISKPFNFANLLASGVSWTIAPVDTDKYHCDVTPNSGIISGDVTNLVVTCVYKLYVNVYGFPAGSVSDTRALIVSLTGSSSSSLNIVAGGLNGPFSSFVGYNGNAVVAVTQDPHILGGIQCVANSTASWPNNLADSQVVSIVCRHRLSVTLVSYGGSGLRLGVTSPETALANVDVADAATSVSLAFYLDSTYTVRIDRQPLSGVVSCSIVAPSGQISANTGPRFVTLNCFISISGTVAGLPAGQTLTLGLTGDATSSTPVTGTNTPGSVAFIFPVTVQAPVASYAVGRSVNNQNYNCSIYFASGTAAIRNVVNVQVVCEYFVHIRVANLPTSPTTTLQVSVAGQILTFANDGTQDLATTYLLSTPLSFAVTRHPATAANQVLCTFVNVTIAPFDQYSTTLTDSVYVDLFCRYRIAVTLNSLAGTNLRVRNTVNGDLLSLPSTGSYFLPTYVTGTVTVVVDVDATNSFCQVGSNPGIVGPSQPLSLAVTCFADLRGTHFGLPAGVTVTLFDSISMQALPVNVPSDTPTNFNFPRIPVPQAYSVTIQSTSSSAVSCHLDNGVGNTIAGNVINLSLVCEYYVRVLVTGYPTAPVQPRDLIVSVTSSTNLVFNTGNVASPQTASITYQRGTPVTLAVVQTPLFAASNCTFLASGRDSNVVLSLTNTTTFIVVCAYTIGGHIVGYAGSGLALTNNNNGDRVIIPPGALDFNMTVSVLGAYSVVRDTQASASTCTVSNGAGSTLTPNVGPRNNIDLNCVVFIGGTVTGLPNGKVIKVTNNGGDETTLTGTAAASFAFNMNTQVNTGASYAVALSASHVDYNCTLTSVSGTASAHVTAVRINCEYFVNIQMNQFWTKAPGPTLITISTPNGRSTLSFTGDTNQRFLATTVARLNTPSFSVSSSHPDMNCTLQIGAPAIAMVDSVTIQCVCTYAVHGTIFGYAGNDMRLRLSGGALTPAFVSPVTTFAMPQSVFGGWTVAFAPSASTSYCTINGSTTAVTDTVTTVSGPVTNLNINCDVAVGGYVSRLFGSGLQITESVSGQSLNFGGPNPGFFFEFPHVATGSQYAVTATSPVNENCTVYYGSGTANAIVRNTNISCEYFMGGTIRGMAGSNLRLNIRYAATDHVFTTNALADPAGNNGFAYTFPRSLVPDTPFTVAVVSNPDLGVGFDPSQVNCSVTASYAANARANMPKTDLDVQCEYKVSVVATGVSGGPLEVAVIAPASKTQTILVNNGVYNFSRTYFPGEPTLNITRQPTSSSCSIDGGGPIMRGPWTVFITCGVIVEIDVLNQNGYNLTFSMEVSNAGVFDKNLLSSNVNPSPSNRIGFRALTTGQEYNVIIVAQPTSCPTRDSCALSRETCAFVSANAGVADSNKVLAVRCDYWVHGQATNQRTGDSLTVTLTTGVGGSAVATPLVLAQGDGEKRFGPTLTVPSGTPFTAVVTSSTPHTGQLCNVTSRNQGAVTAPFTVAVNCAYQVVGLIQGLSGTGLRLQLQAPASGVTSVITLASGATAFAFPVYVNGAYNVTVANQPIDSDCTVSVAGIGTVDDYVDTVRVHCMVRVNGTLSDLTGASVTVALSVAGTVVQTLPLLANGVFAFDPIETGVDYTVTVTAQGSANENCTVISANRVGTAATHVRNLRVRCEYFLSGTVTGYFGATAMVLSEAVAGPLAVSGLPSTASTFRFARSVVRGYGYSVAIATQPNAGTGDVMCAIVPGSGTGTANAPISSISIVCQYRVSFTVAGLVGSGLRVQNNNNAGNDAIAVGTSANGVFSFSQFLAVGATYDVEITQQPSASFCEAALNTGNAATPVSDVRVDCGIVIGGAVLNGTFEAASTLTLAITGAFTGKSRVVSANGNFTFPPILTGATYTVSVTANPQFETCVVEQGATGTADGTKNDVVVNCDYNECAVNFGGCDVNARCNNLLHTGFYCQCNTGWSGNGFACADINECATSKGGCEAANGVCRNTPGSRVCSCNEDTTFGDGITFCHDKYDCVFASGGYGNGGCSGNATCNPTRDFAPHCVCNQGWGGNGNICDVADAAVSAGFITLVLYGPTDAAKFALWPNQMAWAIAGVLQISQARVTVVSTEVLTEAVTNPATCGPAGTFRKAKIKFAILTKSGQSAASLVNSLEAKIVAVRANTQTCSTINDLPISRDAADAPEPGLDNQPLQNCSPNSYQSDCGGAAASSIAAIAAAIIIIVVLAILIGYLCYRKRKYGAVCCAGGEKNKDMELHDMDQSIDLHIAVGASAQGSSSASTLPSATSSAVNSPAPHGHAGLAAAGGKKRKAPTTLRDLLTGDQEFIKIWKAQLQKEFSMENMLFYEAVEEYRKFKLNLENQNLAEPTIRKTLFPKAKEIMASYVAHDVGSAQVNIPENVEARLQKLFKQKFYTNDKVTYIYGPDSEIAPDDDSSYPRPATPSIFDESQEVIFKLMENDSFPRFIKSREYKQLAQFSQS